jgi:acylphosphatase
MFLGIHLIVSGRVQGVCFRAETCEKALQMRLCGWVKNCTNGTVEIYAEGEKKILEQFLSWCRKGPPAAKVSALDIDWIESRGLSDFEIH